MTIDLQVEILEDGQKFFTGQIPESLMWNQVLFEQCWSIRPAERHKVTMFGRDVEVPRDQQAYGKNYSYTGGCNIALPIPSLLRPLLDFARETIFSELNGILVNWYSGSEEYIGPHSDSTVNLVNLSPIVTVSFGETRIFRMTNEVGKEKRTFDYPASHGSVIVLPWETNKAWKHAVPKRARYNGRRISVTMRAFED